MNETKKHRLDKVLKQHIEGYKKLLDGAGPPEFIRIHGLPMYDWSNSISVDENWYAATVKPTGEGNLSITPKYYLEFKELWGNIEYERDFKGFDKDTFCVVDFMEGETISSFLFSMRKESFERFSYGKLKKMFEQYIEENDMDPTGYNEFLESKDGVIHLVISVWDQDSRGEIRGVQYDTNNDSGQDWAVSMAFNELTERVDLADIADYIIKAD